MSLFESLARVLFDLSADSLCEMFKKYFGRGNNIPRSHSFVSTEIISDECEEGGKRVNNLS